MRPLKFGSQLSLSWLLLTGATVSAQGEGTLIVQAFWPDPLSFDVAGSIAEEILFVFVNRERIGTTDSLGRFVGQAPAGEALVEVVLPSSARGARSVEVPNGGSIEVAIVLEDERETGETREVILDEATHGRLNRDFTSFTLRFQERGGTVPVQSVQGVQLLDVALPNSRGILTELFSVADSGAIVATDTATLRRILIGIPPPIRVGVIAVDDIGFSYSGSVSFEFALIADLDADGDVDRDDLAMLLAKRKAPKKRVPAPDGENRERGVHISDPADLNGDGIITAQDARILVAKCTRERCASQ